MYCKNCGKEIPENSIYCLNCGANQNISSTPNPTTNNISSSKTNESKVIAILALVFSILGGWFGILFTIIGLATYKEEENKKLCKIALWICIIWVLITIFAFI